MLIRGDHPDVAGQLSIGSAAGRCRPVALADQRAVDFHRRRSGRSTSQVIELIKRATKVTPNCDDPLFFESWVAGDLHRIASPIDLDA